VKWMLVAGGLAPSLCFRPDLSHIMSIVSRCIVNLSREH
jgi:hypothetical protein